jgi:hypothetical protein
MKHTPSSLLQYEQQLSCCFSMTHGGIALITTTLRWPTYQYLTAKHDFNPGNTPICHWTVMNYIRLPSLVVAILPPRSFSRTFPTNFLIYLPLPGVFSLWRNSPTDTQTLGRTPLNAWSAPRRSRTYKRQTKQTNIHVLSGIRTRDPSNQTTVNLGLRPHGHRDGPLGACSAQIEASYCYYSKLVQNKKFFHYVIYVHLPVDEQDDIKSWNVTVSRRSSRLAETRWPNESKSCWF